MFNLFCLLLLSITMHAHDSYKNAGVDINAGNQFVQAIKPFVKKTCRPGADTEIGGFAGIFDLSKTNYRDPLLVSSTDGVGTKLKLAQAMNKHDTIGQDLVAMCINDLITHGAEPLFFLDYFAMEKLDINQGTELISGITNACTQSNCALIGGETAEMPGMYHNGEYDLAGFTVGIVERENLLPKKDLITQGDVIIGLPSSGIHSNGYSLVRKIIDDNHFDINAPAPYATHHKTFGASLLEPTIVYTNYVLPLCKENLIKAAAHITGGGLLENIPRILPDHLSAQLDFKNWYVPPIFRWLKYIAQIDDQEMARTFNCGIGMALVVDSKNQKTVLERLASQGMYASIIGTISTAKKNNPVLLHSTIPTHAMKVLVVGAGGREHALAWKLAQSPHVGLVLVAPGNGGTAKEPKIRNIPINPQHSNALITYAKQQEIDLVIVGPEAPLANGFVDACTQKGLRCFGPSQAAAMIESSKVFSKKFMVRHAIPTAAFEIFTDSKKAQEYIMQQKLPLVIKANGLASGKGVIIAYTHHEACQATINMLDNASLGQAGKEIVIEQFLEGQEVSFIVMTDGKNILPLATAQDHKKRDAGECGPNTGGMGAYSPAPIITPQLHDKIMTTIIEPTISGMQKENIPFKGFLFAGLMIQNNEPYVLEYNCRLGDPETQAIMMRLKSDLFTMCNAAVEYKLDIITAEWDPRPALGVVVTAGGYPEQYKKGDVIVGLPEKENNDAKIFQAGTAFDNGRLVTNGGRILCATAVGNDLGQARNNAYDLIKNIYWPNAYYRPDIGYRALST